MILLSVIMGMASLQLLKEAVGKIVSLYSGSMPPPTVDYITISIAGFTIGGLLLERGWMVYKLLVRSTLKFKKIFFIVLKLFLVNKKNHYTCILALKFEYFLLYLNTKLSFQTKLIYV